MTMHADKSFTTSAAKRTFSLLLSHGSDKDKMHTDSSNTMPSKIFNVEELNS